MSGVDAGALSRADWFGRDINNTSGRRWAARGTKKKEGKEMALSSLATAVDPEVVSALTTGSANLLPTLMAAGGIAVAVSIGVIGLKKGFTFFRGLIKV